MFFKKKEQEIDIQFEAKPLNYWEESSYMIVPSKEEVTKDMIYERLSKVDGLSIEGMAEQSDERPGRIVFKYLSKNYEIFYYVDEFKMPQIFEYQKKEFSDDEFKKINECKYCITLYMDFTDNFKEEYKVQLTICNYIVDKLYIVLDESSEKVLHPNFVKMIVNSKYLPSTKSLFSVQAVVDNDVIWLHTHGLCRCGFSEIEILNSNKFDYNHHYHLVETLANHILDNGVKDDNTYFVGYLNNDTPIVVTLLPWVEGLLYYKDISLGGSLDRKEEHNTNTGIIFAFENESDISDKLISKLEIYDGKWDDDSIFFITSEETERMSLVARENINYLIKAFNDKDNSIIVKVGVITDNEKDREHMWFDLIDVIDDNNFKLKLLSEPYNVSNMHPGDEGIYGLDKITDWIIYTKDYEIGPDRVYLLD